MIVGKPLHPSKAETEGEKGGSVTALPLLQGTIPPARIDADGAQLDCVIAGVADELGDSVKAHGLGVEQSRTEGIRMIMLHPGRGIGDLGEAGGVAFRKAVASEAFDLLERPL